jgi:protein FRA10AC1
MDDKRHLHRYVKPVPTSRPRTKHALEILQQRHRFLRDEDEETQGKQGQSSSSTEEWEERLSKSWYDKLFREYALCDLSRYKEGGVALRWRVEQEVLDRVGEVSWL